MLVLWFGVVETLIIHSSSHVGNSTFSRPLNSLILCFLAKHEESISTESLTSNGIIKIYRSDWDVSRIARVTSFPYRMSVASVRRNPPR